jgi:two-component system sensor histidine kinase BaeS
MALRHSLLIRLLAVSLAVATLAVGATAWLITRDTTDALRSDIERSLERDNHIHQELLAFGATHPTWDGVDALVAGVAADTGERVALTTPDGTLVADSAAVGGDAPSLPATPVAMIDPLTAEPPPAPALSVEEQRRRTPEALEAAGCLADQGSPRPVLPERIVPPALGGDLQLSDLRWDTVPAEVVDLCVPAYLFAPSPAEEALAAGVKSGVVACMAARGQAAASACLDEATRTARDMVRADPALLYLGTPGAETRFDALWGADRARTAATVAAVLAVVAAVTILAGRRLVRPIRALTRAAQRMEAGDQSARVPAAGRDEVGGLAHAFNAMAESLEASDQQRRAMVSDVAHELRTPLANIQGYLEAAQDGVVPTDDALVASLLDDATTLGRLVDDLQVLALADAGRLTLRRQPVDAAEVVQAAVAAQRGAAAAARVELEADAPGAVPVVADPDRLRQVLGNLVGNALRYTHPGGRIGVAAAVAGGGAVLTVRDTGVGIAPEHLPHVFDRFYRCDPSRSRETGGSGLGLAIVRQLVEAHGGTVTAASVPGEGSTFTVRLPLAPGADRPGVTTARSPAGPAPGSAASTRAG